jgi:hypothetical protein
MIIHPAPSTESKATMRTTTFSTRMPGSETGSKMALSLRDGNILRGTKIAKRLKAQRYSPGALGALRIDATGKLNSRLSISSSDSDNPSRRVYISRLPDAILLPRVTMTSPKGIQT